MKQAANTAAASSVSFGPKSPSPEIDGVFADLLAVAKQQDIEAYEMLTGNIVMPSEFIVHPKYDWLGCSPDGLINDDGGTESKCPFNEAIHVRTWLEGMPEEHMAQVQGCMFVTGRKWWDFLSFDSRQDEECQLYIETIYRDEEYIANPNHLVASGWIAIPAEITLDEAQAAKLFYAAGAWHQVKVAT